MTLTWAVFELVICFTILTTGWYCVIIYFFSHLKVKRLLSSFRTKSVGWLNLFIHLWFSCVCFFVSWCDEKNVNSKSRISFSLLNESFVQSYFASIFSPPRALKTCAATMKVLKIDIYVSGVTQPEQRRLKRDSWCFNSVQLESMGSGKCRTSDFFLSQKNFARTMKNSDH